MKFYYLTSTVIVILFLSFIFYFGKSNSDFYIEYDLIIPYASSVEILNKKSKVIGSGIIIKNEAKQSMLVLSVYHVVEEKENDIYISVPYDDVKRKALILKKDKNKDLVILKVIEPEIKKGPFVKISNKEPKIGQRIWTISCPLGKGKVVTDGIISDIMNEETHWKSGKKINSSIYRMTAPIFYGSSGGGLFNFNGELIGVILGIGEVPSYINVKSDDGKKTIESSDIFCKIPEPGAFFAISLGEIIKLIEK